RRRLLPPPSTSGSPGGTTCDGARPAYHPVQAELIGLAGTHWPRVPSQFIDLHSGVETTGNWFHAAAPSAFGAPTPLLAANGAHARFWFSIVAECTRSEGGGDHGAGVAGLEEGDAFPLYAPTFMALPEGKHRLVIIIRTGFAGQAFP